MAAYLRDRSREERAASFDYCFNYFQGFRSSAPTMTSPGPFEPSQTAAAGEEQE